MSGKYEVFSNQKAKEKLETANESEKEISTVLETYFEQDSTPIQELMRVVWNIEAIKT